MKMDPLKFKGTPPDFIETMSWFYNKNSKLTVSPIFWAGVIEQTVKSLETQRKSYRITTESHSRGKF